MTRYKIKSADVCHYVMDERTGLLVTTSPKTEAGREGLTFLADMWNATHHASVACGVMTYKGVTLTTSEDWTKVTCGDCRLEQSMQTKAHEYRIPTHQRTFLAETLPAIAREQKRLAALQGAEEEVLAEIEAKEALLEEVREARKASESRLSALVRTERGSAEGTDTLAEALAGATPLRAPVNAVDIREGASLSDAAVKILMSVPGHAEGTFLPIPYPASESKARSELFEAGLIGPKRALTRKGSILKERMENEQLDKLFPL